MDPELGLELTSRRLPNPPRTRRFERTDSAAERSRNPNDPPHSVVPDTLHHSSPSAAPAGLRPKSLWAKIGVAAKYVAVAGAAIGVDHAGIAISTALRAAPKPHIDPPLYMPPRPAPYPAQNELTYVRYGQLNIHSNLTGAFHESLSDMYKSRKMNETLAYLHEAPLHWSGQELTINPAQPGHEETGFLAGVQLSPNSDSYNPISHSITWNPKTKYYTAQESAENQVTSSTTGLITQLHNAKDALQNLPAYYALSGFSHPDFGNLQEKSAIEQTNAVNKEIKRGQIQHVDLERDGYAGVTNSTLDTSLPSDVAVMTPVDSSKTNATAEIESVRDSATDENAAATRSNALQYTRAKALQSTRITQAAFFGAIDDFEARIASDQSSYFLNSFNVTNFNKIQDFMRAGEAIMLDVEDVAAESNYRGPALNATVEARLKNYTEAAENFAKALFDDSGDTYIAKARNTTGEYQLTPDMTENEVTAAPQFQMGASANATLNRLQSQAAGTVEAQIAALRSTANR